MTINTKSGYYANGVFNMTPKECFRQCNAGAIIVDVRETYMSNFKMFKVDNILYIPHTALKQSYEELPFDQTLIFADAVGLKSRESVLFMKSHGYENVANMAGGIVDWERDGLPVSTDINGRLSGSCMCQLKQREGVKRRGEDGEMGGNNT
jgi:rhodanese-related sulfurtransferase